MDWQFFVSKVPSGRKAGKVQAAVLASARARNKTPSSLPGGQLENAMSARHAAILWKRISVLSNVISSTVWSSGHILFTPYSSNQNPVLQSVVRILSWEKHAPFALVQKIEGMFYFPGLYIDRRFWYDYQKYHFRGSRRSALWIPDSSWRATW